MSWTRADVAVSIGLGTVAALLATTALHAQDAGPRGKANRTKCANNLRMLGLAQIQYSDDKRFFPHLGPIKDLDGGYTTSSSTRKTRAMMFFGYHDDPAGFVCPSTKDLDEDVPEAAKQNGKLWFWGGQPAPAGPNGVPANPLSGADAPDPALHETGELSYGWSRRGMNSNVRSTALLTADRTDANHGEGWNVGQADGTVLFVARAEGEKLTLVEGPEAGYLAIRAKDDPAPKAAGPRREAGPFEGTWTDGDISVRLRGGAGAYTGSIEVDRKRHPATAKGDAKRLEGSFEANGGTFQFTATLEGETLVLVSGSSTYRLSRR